MAMDVTTDEAVIVGDGLMSPFGGGLTRAWSGLSWSAVIAGALTAIAVTIIVAALGSGIGMELVSPYSSSSPSTETMTVIGALWLVFSQAIGFATGGYIAGRLRRPPTPVHDDEVKFRDGANGLVVWAIGVVVGSLVLAVAVGKIGSTAGSAASTAVASLSSASQPPSIDYFVDDLLRPGPQGAASGAAGAAPGAATGTSNAAPNGAAPNGAAPSGAAPNSPNSAASPDQRAQISRILLTGLSPSGISNDDRAYLAQIVSAHTGLSQEDAQRRVDSVIDRAKQDATQAAETARKAAAYVSFWTFMSLLFGAVCATLGGILGGDLRDEFAVSGTVPTSPR